MRSLDNGLIFAIITAVQAKRKRPGHRGVKRAGIDLQPEALSQENLKNIQPDFRQ